ncbi:hypothetical protein GWC95_17320 [Sediminibacterium roseum]|uniref:WG containing repeat-containing protein n=1 Tax=Sediminibacterium roseum TaxID=1978412 RepID=A0ABX0A061_9BACT|nr:hypothetical protein [Sediminibacterium roseum]NCI51688.1 hypothetical protein [Sediminibacterium roseum]
MKKMIFLFCMAVGCCTFTQAQDAPKDSTLKEYIGKYLFPSGSVIAETNVSLGDDGVLTSSSSAGVSELVKREKDVFEIPKFQGTAKFVRDANGKVMGVVIDAMGYHLEGTKSENGMAAMFFPAKAFVAVRAK